MTTRGRGRLGVKAQSRYATARCAGCKSREVGSQLRDGSPVLRIEVFATSPRMEPPMTYTTTIDVLRQRLIEDMTARKLGPGSQKSRLRAYKRFAA
jgi:hypothetical protein